MRILALDIGGSFIKYGFFEGKKLKHIGKIKTKKRREEFKDQIKGIIKGFKFDALSLAIPYPYDAKRDLWSPPNFPFRNFKLKNFLKQLGKFKIFIQNDANLAALAEAKARGIANLVLLTLGTGLGSGVIINSKLYIGNSYASEIGHSIIVKNGLTCSCGNKGCAEAYISVRALQRYYGKEISIEKLASLARKRDKKAKKAFEIFADYLAILLSNIANIFNPELIVLSGGLTHFGDLFLKQAVKKFGSMAFKQTRCKIEISKLSDLAGVYGALFYALEH